jgi:hypothetical protein
MLRVHNPREHLPVVPYWTPVEGTNPETVSVLSEIDLYLAGYNSMFRWIFCISKCRDPQKIWNHEEFTVLRVDCIDKLPIGMGLKQIRLTDPVTRSYRTVYATYDSRSLYSVNRPAVLVTVTNLLHSMRALRTSVDLTLTTEQCAQVEAHYNATKTAFDVWMTVARPHVIPVIHSLRESEETGRRRIRTPRPNLTRESRLCDPCLLQNSDTTQKVRHRR